LGSTDEKKSLQRRGTNEDITSRTADRYESVVKAIWTRKGNVEGNPGRPLWVQVIVFRNERSLLLVLRRGSLRTITRGRSLALPEGGRRKTRRGNRGVLR